MLLREIKDRCQPFYQKLPGLEWNAHLYTLFVQSV